jgi:hypothetical protein
MSKSKEMGKKLSKVACALVLSLTAGGCSGINSKPGSDSLFPQAFQASYSVQCPQKLVNIDHYQFTKRHLFSDGNGKLRDDSLDATTGLLRVRVIDLTNNEVLCWDEGAGVEQKYYPTKIIMTGSVPAQAAVPTFYDRTARSVLAKRKSLGEKELQGHKCTGYGDASSSFGGLAPMSSPGPIWMDIEPAYYGMLVEDQSPIRTTMSTFSNNTPAPELFKPPSNYTRNKR